MKYIRTIAKYLVAFGAGAATAMFFLSGPIDPQTQQPSATAANGGWVLVPPTTQLSWADEKFDHPVEPPQQSTRPATDSANAETTGSSAPERAANTADHGQVAMTPQRGAACNVSLCRSFYSSFDEATCTYRPYGGGPPQLCNR